MKKSIFTALLVSFLAFASPSQAATTYVDVNGLVCDFCARALEQVFGKEDAVKDVLVDLDTKVITVNFKDGMRLEDQKITQLIEDSGYNVVAIRDEKATPNE